MYKEKIKQILSYQIPTDKVMFVILFAVNTFLAVGNAENTYYASDNILPFVEWVDGDFFWKSYGTLLLLWFLLSAITKRIFLSHAIVQVITFAWGTLNRITWKTRKMFVAISDLQSAEEAAKVRVDFASISDSLWIALIVANLVVLGINLYGHFKGWCRITRKDKKVLWGRIGGIIGAISVFLFVYAIRPASSMIYQVNACYHVGSVVWFCQSFFSDFAHGITKEEVVEIYEEFEERMAEKGEYSEKRPNIIVVMSEAFWDINYVSDALEMSENPMDDYERLAEGAIAGEVAVNVYGGGTYTTEFEFLTGLNAFYLGGVPNLYRTYYGRKQESLVSYLEELGYNTMAFHPYEGDFWDRDMGYANMGFDEFYDITRFENREKYHGYISDGSLTEEIIQRFTEQKEKEPDEPVFSFSVSVQNHINDLTEIEEFEKRSDTDTDVKVKSLLMDAGTKKDVEEYVNGLGESIEALEELIHYFENYEEDTMIVFFGDHAPTFATELLDSVLEGEESSLYRTPYLVWTNYENDYEEYGDMNVSCLSAVMLEYLGLPKPKQFYINKYLLETYPIINKFETVQLSSEHTDEMNDITNIAYYVYEHFPKEENALPFWQISD